MQHKSSSGNVCQGGSFVQRQMQPTRCHSQLQCAAPCPELYICLIVSLVSFKDLHSRFGIKYVRVQALIWDGIEKEGGKTKKSALICDGIEQELHAMPLRPQVLAADSLLKQREEPSAALAVMELKTWLWKHELFTLEVRSCVQKWLRRWCCRQQKQHRSGR